MNDCAINFTKRRTSFTDLNTVIRKQPRAIITLDKACNLVMTTVKLYGFYKSSTKKTACNGCFTICKLKFFRRKYT